VGAAGTVPKSPRRALRRVAVEGGYLRQRPLTFSAPRPPLLPLRSSHSFGSDLSPGRAADSAGTAGACNIPRREP